VNLGRNNLDYRKFLQHLSSWFDRRRFILWAAAHKRKSLTRTEQDASGDEEQKTGLRQSAAAQDA